MSNISNSRIVSLLFCISLASINASCTQKKSSSSTPASEVEYKTFTEKTSYSIDFPPVGIDSDTDYDTVFKIDVRNDTQDNWLYWNRNATSAKVDWTLWCYAEEGEDSVITSGAFEFNRNPTKFASNQTYDLRFSRALISGGCNWRQIYLQFGGPQYFSENSQDFFPVAFFNMRDEVVRKGRFPEGIVRRIKNELPAKTIEIAKIQSAMLKVSGTQRDIYCTIKSYTDPLLEGSALELTHIYENQFGSIENQTIDCDSPLDMTAKINACLNSTSDDQVFCIIYEKYKQTSSWLTSSIQLLRDIEQDTNLSVETARLRVEALSDLESKLATFGQ